MHVRGFVVRWGFAIAEREGGLFVGGMILQFGLVPEGRRVVGILGLWACVKVPVQSSMV